MIVPSVSDFPVAIPQADMSDMIANTASHQFKRANVKAYLDQRNKGWEVNQKFMNPVAIRDQTMIQKPCRDSINNVTRQAKIAGGKEKLLGARPQTGTDRNQPKGLESDGFFEPRPIMALPDYFTPALNTPLI